jgi:hypothetical protein
MIYFTGFQNWGKQFGTLVSIANSEPKGFKGHIDRLHFFAPDWKDVNLWKTSPKTDADWERFVAMYRIVCRERWRSIEHWLQTLKPEVDMTLLCWERESKRCHRSLAAKFVEVYRPDCYGGLDMLNPYRKRQRHNNVDYDIQVVSCPWCDGFAYEISVGVGIGKIGDDPDYPYLRGVYALPEYAIEAAVLFVKGD